MNEAVKIGSYENDVNHGNKIDKHHSSTQCQLPASVHFQHVVLTSNPLGF